MAIMSASATKLPASTLSEESLVAIFTTFSAWLCGAHAEIVAGSRATRSSSSKDFLSRTQGMAGFSERRIETTAKGRPALRRRVVMAGS